MQSTDADGESTGQAEGRGPQASGMEMVEEGREKSPALPTEESVSHDPSHKMVGGGRQEHSPEQRTQGLGSQHPAQVIDTQKSAAGSEKSPSKDGRVECHGHERKQQTKVSCWPVQLFLCC